MLDTIIPPLTLDDIEEAARLAHPGTRAMEAVRRALLSDRAMRTLVDSSVHDMDRMPDGVRPPYVNVAGGYDEDDAQSVLLFTYAWGRSYIVADTIAVRIAAIMESGAAGAWTAEDVESFSPTLGEKWPPVVVVSRFRIRADLV